MLRDHDPMHRVSALWAVRRARVGPLGEDVRHMAATDGVGLLRRRAKGTLRAMGATAVAAI